MIDGKRIGVDTGATLADANTVPTTFALVQNYPDLFNPSSPSAANYNTRLT